MTTQSARLITPDGRTIELAPEIYQEIKQLLSNEARLSSKDEINRVLADTYGMLAQEDSLTEALLRSRKKERAREARKISGYNN